MKQVLTEELFDRLYDETEHGVERVEHEVKKLLMDYIMEYKDNCCADDSYYYDDFKIEVGTTIDVIFKKGYKCRFRFDCERFDVDIDDDLFVNSACFNEYGEKLLSEFDGWLCNL